LNRHTVYKLFHIILFISTSYLETLTEACDSAVGIATGYWLEAQGVGFPVPVGLRIFSSPRSPDRLWGPPNLLSNGLFPLG
jgi:hypothetical protein